MEFANHDERFAMIIKITTENRFRSLLSVCRKYEKFDSMCATYSPSYFNWHHAFTDEQFSELVFDKDNRFIRAENVVMHIGNVSFTLSMLYHAGFFAVPNENKNEIINDIENVNSSYKNLEVYLNTFLDASLEDLYLEKPLVTFPRGKSMQEKICVYTDGEYDSGTVKRYAEMKTFIMYNNRNNNRNNKICDDLLGIICDHIGTEKYIVQKEYVNFSLYFGNYFTVYRNFLQKYNISLVNIRTMVSNKIYALLLEETIARFVTSNYLNLELGKLHRSKIFENNFHL